MAVVSKRHNIVIYIVVSPSCTLVFVLLLQLLSCGVDNCLPERPKNMFWSNNELRNDPNIPYQVKRLMYFKAVHVSSVFFCIWIGKAKIFEPPRFCFCLLATLRCLLLLFFFAVVVVLPCVLLHTCSFSWSKVQWVGSSLSSYRHYLYELGKRGRAWDSKCLTCALSLTVSQKLALQRCLTANASYNNWNHYRALLFNKPFIQLGIK